MAHAMTVMIALAVKTVRHAGDVQTLLIVAGHINLFATQDALHVVAAVIAVEVAVGVDVMKAIVIHVRLAQVV